MSRPRFSEHMIHSKMSFSERTFQN